ncbi:MAG TPA: hypothetical protein VF868_15865 [Bacteroidia bacterium]|jgi:hypothetical protein
MKNFNWDRTWIGLILGLIAPFISLCVYYLVNYNYMTIGGFINYMKLGNTYTPVISLCVLTNLVPFYLLVNKEKYAGTKGVLGATFVWAGIVLFLKFFTE